MQLIRAFLSLSASLPSRSAPPHSQNMDDSPNSDNKMDISEPTISQESFGLSPECDDHKTTPIIRADSTEFAATIGITTNASFTASNESGEHACPALNRPTAPAQCSPPSNRSSPTKRRHTNAEPNDNKLADSSSSLDNRLTTCTNKTKIVNSKQRTDWTLVDMHPLMPNDAESPDSPPMDASHAFAGIAADRTAPEEAATAPPPERPAEWQTTASPLAAQPDLLEVATAKGSAMTSSGESEPDLSQYEASVEPTYQSVSMTNHNSAGGPSGLAVPKASHLRRISLTSELRSKFDDDSSIDTASNNSFDGDDSDANDDFGAKRDGKQPKVGESRPNADSPAASSSRDGGAAAKDASNAVTLSDGRTRDIDMKVIEPYKRCLSHGGYIQSPGNNAIVIFSACYLPDRSRADYNYVMDNLFL